mgnify:CR=1 FL=1|tara:strand:+ start:1049 stop:1240 length:192 start_codon:yes stop_codon:yes gene_type:complete
MLNPRKMQNIDLEFHQRQADAKNTQVSREVEQSKEIAGKKHVPPQEEQIKILPSELAELMLDA